MESNKKYRYTRQLINMALRDGWTQNQIADACRTQQSVVSSWKNGATQAKESQLVKLLEVYGPKLRRKSFKIYHAFQKDDCDELSVQIIKVEGEAIFTFPYRNKEFCTVCRSEWGFCSCHKNSRKILPTRRIIVHAMGKGNFCLLHQRRLIKDEFQMQFPETNIYVTTVVGRFAVQELLRVIDLYAKRDEPEEKMDTAEYLMVQMLAKKALLEHGYPIEGIEEHLADW
jgi:hypothetical protein